MPFVERWVDKDNRTQERIALRHFLPRTLSVRGRADVEVRRRGIFDVPVFVAQLHVEGALVVPEAARFAVSADDILWQRASVSLGISDPKAIRACSPLSIGGRQLAFEPGPGDAALASGLNLPLPLHEKPGTTLPFSFDLTLGGSSRLSVVPAGDETTVTLSSPGRTRASTAPGSRSRDGSGRPASTPPGRCCTWRAASPRAGRTRRSIARACRPARSASACCRRSIPVEPTNVR